MLIRRLRQAGFGSDFVSAAILPDWWDQSCLNQPELLPEIEIRVGRFLAIPLSTVSDPESTLEPLGYPDVRLRCVRDIDRDRLAPVIHAAMKIAGTVVRNLAPVVDEDEETLPDDEMKELADEYAIRTLVGETTIPKPGPKTLGNFRNLATQAAAAARETGVDAGSIIFSWVRTTGDYATATRATKALYLATGATRVLRRYFNRFVDVEGASVSDRELMRVIVPGSPLSADASSR